MGGGRRYVLSKSKYIRGLQCQRALWLDVHRPRLAHYSVAQLQLFSYGREFERKFKAGFEGGVDISARLGRRIGEYAELTAELLEGGGEVVLFEAGFVFNGVLVLADVVRQRADGALEVYEVKSGRTLSETYKRDAAVQYYVISNLRRVERFCLVFDGCGTDSGVEGERFEVVDLTGELADEAGQVAANVASMKEWIAGGEPWVPMGEQCLSPYACPYREYCASLLPLEAGDCW
ncbi:MAG: hypothetical protein IJU19_05965 [Bacteroidales bacterium]|nr:hypothetical protein [Bacteroidales bacterium]